MGELSSKNILAAIEKSKRVPLNKFIYALGIRHVGERTALILARFCSTIKRLREVTETELLEVAEIGEETARAIAEYVADSDEQAMLERLLSKGLKILPVEQVTEAKFSGKTFVLTGTMSTMSRKEAEDKISAFGGKVSSSVSKKTDYVVVGAEPGSKFDKARELGVAILNEDQFKELLAS
jgi:DNA ligase (NAD+)